MPRWGILYVPRTQGEFKVYDSGDPAVIDEHLEMISEAGIDLWSTPDFYWNMTKEYISKYRSLPPT